MSRAFVKEDSGEDALPDLPLSPHPNYTTPAGRELMEARRVSLQQRLTAALAAQVEGRVGVDGDTPAQVRRELRWVEARLAAAIVVPPPSSRPERVAFGVQVQLEDDDGRAYTFRLVGEDEADAERGLLSWASPLAGALLGARVGDEVTWPRPTGAVNVAVVDITG
jgi:transcription elongation factor GreB